MATKSVKKTYTGVGRRKMSVARVHITPGKGKVSLATEQGKFDSFEAYWGANTEWLTRVIKPLKITGSLSMFSITMNVNGGGIKGQAEAASLALAHALVSYEKENPDKVSVPEVEIQSEGKRFDEELFASSDDQSRSGEDSKTNPKHQEIDANEPLVKIRLWHAALKKEGMLSTDPRIVLRKLVGLVKARKAKQFSKR
jgi:ribosomal protein S9